MAISTSKTASNFTKDSKTRLKSRDIYSLKGFCEKMSTPEPEGSTTGVAAAERTQAGRYSSEAWLQSNRAHRGMAEESHLEVRHIDWASQSIGEALYMHTMWILMRQGNDPLGSKINRRAQVEAELGISMGVSRGGEPSQ